MLKISVDTVKEDIIIQLEGRLALSRGEELENVWSAAIRVMSDTARARVDLQSLTYVDTCGKQ